MTISPARLASGLLLALGGWMAVLALVLRLGGPAPGVLVVLPRDEFLHQLPEGVTVTERSAFGFVLRFTDPDSELVAKLYQAGARLVLPGGLAGCLSLAVGSGRNASGRVAG